MDKQALVAMALEARKNAHPKYSGFHVGAALLAADGRVFTGGNIESSSYGLTVCAERVAAFKAISEGAREFVAMAVASDAKASTPPCGACRQVLWDLCRNITLLLAGSDGSYIERRVEQLFPEPFDERYFAPEDK